MFVGTWSPYLSQTCHTTTVAHEYQPCPPSILLVYLMWNTKHAARQLDCTHQPSCCGYKNHSEPWKSVYAWWIWLIFIAVYYMLILFWNLLYFSVKRQCYVSPWTVLRSVLKPIGRFIFSLKLCRRKIFNSYNTSSSAYYLYFIFYFCLVEQEVVWLQYKLSFMCVSFYKYKK